MGNNNVLLKIFLPDGAKDIDRFTRAIAVDDLVGDVARNAPEIAGFKLLAFAADDEGGFAFEKYADLFMRMGMFLDDGIGFQVDDGQHHLLARASGDVNSGEDGVTDKFIASWKKEAHGGVDSKEKARWRSMGMKKLLVMQENP
jgi:hypothetical protein